jgi:hypothetical protein
MPAGCPEMAADYVKVSDKVCVLLVEGRAPTSKDACNIIGIGSGPRQTGIAVEIATYYGYEDGSLWKKLGEWVKS